MTTFDPANKGTNIALSGGNLIATFPSATNGWGTVLSTTSKSSGKFYFEILIGSVPNASPFGANWEAGFCQNDVTINGVLGNDGDSAAASADMSSFGAKGFGIVSVTQGNIAYTTAVATDVLGFALDFDAGKAWISKNNTFGGSPVAGTSPAWAWTPAGSWFAAWAANCFNSSTPAVGTLRPDTASQSFAAPSGFSAWDAVAPSTTLFAQACF